jgi:3-oxoacyl-[acyl-carrier-protein] synthase III
MNRIQTPGVRIAGVSCAVPRHEAKLSEMADFFTEEEIAKVSKMTGVAARRVVQDGTCTSDLCATAADSLLNRIGWERDSVDLLLFLSQTPDYVLPATACALHGRLDLSPACVAFDVNLGCSGYVYGLSLCSSLLAAGGYRRALLLVGDTISRCVSPQDRSTALLFGDAGTATALEPSPDAADMFYVLGTDGKGEKNLIIPAGGFRQRPTAETLTRLEGEDGSIRSASDLYMNGNEILSFTLRSVPKLVEETLAFSGQTVEEVDAVIFHQANLFMLDHIMKKAKVPKEKAPISLDRFGNTSSASIPLTMVTERGSQLTEQGGSLILAGFGVGYSWGGAAVRIQPGTPMEFIEE